RRERRLATIWRCEVVLMLLRQRYFKILSVLVPAGAVGVSVLLGSTAPSSANQSPADLPYAASNSVSERLAAIRAAVSALAERDRAGVKSGDGEPQLAWGNWWRNGGWYRPWRGWGWPNWPNWRNWNNWPNWWRNW